MAKLAIKSETCKQKRLFPLDLEEMIPQTHIVRVVDMVIDRLDISPILGTYKGGGRSAFNPRTMFKLLVYAYLCNIYSYRKIAQATVENIHFMWLSGMNAPDWRTVNYFRGKRLREHFDSLFTQVVLLLQEEGFVSLRVQYVDGTKVESCANKYTFVWRKSVEKNQSKLKERLSMLLQKIEEEHELVSGDLPSSDAVSVEEFQARVARIKSSIDAQKASKEVKRQLKQVEEKDLPKLESYREQLEIMGERGWFCEYGEYL